MASVATALFLVGLKIFALYKTGSVAVLSGLTDSSLDLFASFLNFLAVRGALEPADETHRFGHGKIEALGSTGQAAFIAGSACLLAFQAVTSLLSPKPVSRPDVGIAVMGISVAASLVLIVFQRYVVKKTGSIAVSADYAHYAGDVLLNSSVMVSLFLGKYVACPLIDPLFGLGIAVYLIFCAVRIWKTAFAELTDEELDADTKRKIVAIVRQNPDVLGIHDLRTRSSGEKKFVQMHLELDSQMTLERAHAVSDAVESAVTAAFPDAEVLIHQDPSGLFENHSKLAYDLN